MLPFSSCFLNIGLSLVFLYLSRLGHFWLTVWMGGERGKEAEKLC